MPRLKCLHVQCVHPRKCFRCPEEPIFKVHILMDRATIVAAAQELCTGGDLIEAVKEIPKCKGLAYKEARVGQLMREVMKILDTCHSKGILHRDVKPENFLLSSKRRKAQGRLPSLLRRATCVHSQRAPSPPPESTLLAS